MQERKKEGKKKKDEANKTCNHESTLGKETNKRDSTNLRQRWMTFPSPPNVCLSLCLSLNMETELLSPQRHRSGCESRPHLLHLHSHVIAHGCVNEQRGKYKLVWLWSWSLVSFFCLYSLGGGVVHCSLFFWLFV